MGRLTLKNRLLLTAAAGAGTLTILGGNFACANLMIPPCQPDEPFCNSSPPDADAATADGISVGDVQPDADGPDAPNAGADGATDAETTEETR